ncbi:MAG: hypothetical protein RIB59_01515 [Rhodospirillales bacterium]
MKKTEYETNIKIRRNWIRVWVILIPIWILSVSAVWLFIDKFLFDNETGIARNLMIEWSVEETPDTGLKMAPASGAQEAPGNVPPYRLPETPPQDIMPPDSP